MRASDAVFAGPVWPAGRAPVRASAAVFAGPVWPAGRAPVRASAAVFAGPLAGRVPLEREPR